jgi:hypothetical protein
VLPIVKIFLKTPFDTESHLAGVHPVGVQVNTFNFSDFHKASFNKYQMKSSLTIHSSDNQEKFFVVKESYISSITPYQESSFTDSVVGDNTHVVFGIQTCGATFVHLVASIHNQIADCLPINASLILIYV